MSSAMQFSRSWHSLDTTASGTWSPESSLKKAGSFVEVAPDSPIERQVVVNANLERAFRAFTQHFSTWWPRDYTWSQDVLEEIGIEPRLGGHCFERAPGGFQCHWGTVITWDPPSHLAFLWQIAPDRTPEPNPANASEVHVIFEIEDSHNARVTVQHSLFSRHGSEAKNYRAAMDSERGWSMILGAYARSLG